MLKINEFSKESFAYQFILSINNLTKFKHMKRKDPRLLNECKDKVIPLANFLKSENTPNNPVFENFIKATEYYENLTFEYNQTITNAENLHRQIVEHEKLLRDIKERTKAAVVLYYGKNSHLYRTFMLSSEYKKSVQRIRLREKKMKK
jgi:hypothetical protein